jgi:hypothetical protein
VLENPLAYYHIARRTEDQVPRVVRQHGLVLLHSVAPVGIAKCATNRGRDWRQRQGSGSDGRKLRAIHGLGDPSSTTDDMFFTGYCSEGFDEFCYFRDRDAHETSSPYGIYVAKSFWFYDSTLHTLGFERSSAAASQSSTLGPLSVP